MRVQRLWLVGAISLVLLAGNSDSSPWDAPLASPAAPPPSGDRPEPTPAAIETTVPSTPPSPVMPAIVGKGYPRLASLWTATDSASGAAFWGSYDLFIPYQLHDSIAEVAAIRHANPDTRVLLSLDTTHGRPGFEPLATAWWDSKPGDPGYNCLLRDSQGAILLVQYWGHPMFNLTVPHCRQMIVERNVAGFQSQQSAEGPLYDGIYWDLLHGTISWLSSDIDSDLDGRPDAPDTLNAAYRAGVEDVLAQVRTTLPSAIFVGNEAARGYERWINGRLFEWQLSAILDDKASFTWDDTLEDYRGWADAGILPRMTFIQSAPEAIFEEKHPYQSPSELPVAMHEEAAASYQRMRYGLTTALMGDGLFSYDTRIADSGVWWYDEFGAPVGAAASTLPPRGYLGLPTGAPRLLVDRLRTPDQVTNGDFGNGLAGWDWWVNGDASAAATIEVEPQGGMDGTAAVHVHVTHPAEAWDVQLQQAGKTIVAGAGYTLSFWARSDVTRTLTAKIAQHPYPGVSYGFNVHTVVTPQWRHYHLWDAPTVTANDGEIKLNVGGDAGDLWLDGIQFQAGAIGVWARPFQNGLAVINTTTDTQTVALPGSYCRLQGDQAPLFQVRVDDDEASASAGWREFPATASQFGRTVKEADGGTGASATYAPALAYAGAYEVLAWVVPGAGRSQAVSVTLSYEGGAEIEVLNETAGEIGWHSLGVYTFAAGTTGSATLTATGAGAVVADAIKWVSVARYNDGSRVDQVTLQPQDGIVLLSSCYTPGAASLSPDAAPAD